ncbi:unnamed protein product [Cyclocybe aegerita]|uniref:1-phosphatidylinositol 4-kinase n=1 Tax=Cyclocybe aegerita TaxID=1973307 RepID=A0A8S0WDC5_CYCAE|nr:unnamed protein product [Cyclocybe aegerita]
MDFLELNIHQRILSNIACNEDGSYAQQILSQKVEAHADYHEAAREDEQETEEVETEPGESTERVFMSASRVHCNIAFGELVVNFPIPQISSSIETVIPVLVGILREIPTIDFDKSLSWEDWALPDQLVFSTISALLRIANEHPDHSGQATAAIFTFISRIIQNIHSSTSLDVLTQLMPALHGFYRAISSTSYQWNLSQWETLTLHLKKLCSSHSIERLNHLLVDILQKENADADTLRYVQTFITRYVNQGRPLSGYFMVCCVLETEWTVLAQALAPPISARSPLVEAAAANKAWLSLTRNAALELDVENEATKVVLKKTINYAMQCFTDLLSQIEEMDCEPPIDTYAWETLSESLKLATICCLVQREIDEQLHTRILLLLSTESPISDNLVQEAALKATTVLVRSFPDIAGNMVVHLRRFVTSPMPLFEFGFPSESRAPPPLSAAAKCLALCVRLAPGDDLIMSNMYSLLNYIAATSKDIFDSSSIHMQNHAFNSHGRGNAYSLETGLRGLSEDEKRLVGISTISAVTKLALEFKMEEVTRLTISMLLQRLPSAEPTVEAAIAYNLVDLALTAPRTAFTDIIRAFSAINRSANPDDPRFSNNMVLAAQTRLAQELHRRPELYEYYLVELLTLFADKGVAIQNLKIANHHVKTDDMIEQLASLLLAIDALLAHPDFNPHKEPSPEIIGLFRNTWFLCVLFGFTTDETKEWAAMDWLKPALARIAVKTPSMVVEEAHDAVASDVEYNSVIRQEYANAVISKHRNHLTRYITYRASEIRYLSAGQVIFILTLHDIESMRSAAGYPSSLVSYFINDSLNNHSGLSACMESVAEKVIRDSINDLNFKASQQTLPKHLSPELHSLVVLTTHRIAKARDIASKYLNRLITSFPSLMCDPTLVFAILEVLTLLQRACENEYLDEYNPVYEFHSDRSRITLQLSDSYQVRNDILGQLKRNANTWFELALGRAPMELQSTLQKYLSVNPSLSGINSAELGASIAEQFGKAIGPVHRQLSSLSSFSPWNFDAAKTLSSQIAIKGYFAGEAAGIRLANRESVDKLATLPPQRAPPTEIEALKIKLSNTLEEIRGKKSKLTVHDLRRLLFRCAATLISMEKSDYDLLAYLVSLPFGVASPSAIASGVDVWSWVIAERSEVEVALMSEILSAWSNTIKQRKGLFSKSLNYEDPFYHPISYSPTDKESMDRDYAHARRVLTPHALVLQMLFSRLQAARYHRPGVMFLIQHLVLRSAQAFKTLSTHALSREARYSFLLFGFEALKSSHLDAYCENVLRESLYTTALSWFSVRPQWSYGANRVQVDADIKVLSEFLSYLQSDSVRGPAAISSLSPSRLSATYYAERMGSLNLPLRLLTENEISRLSVWSNPTNDVKRGADIVGNMERTLLDTAWPGIVRTLWRLDPAVAVYLTERFKNPHIRYEVGKLVRSNTTDVLDIPDALSFLLGDRLDPRVRRDLKHLILWAPVPPIIANTYFERRFNSDPLVLQYAHRVLVQHPVELTFFFIPQIVQALRYDDLGYVARFIFETAKISQLFCHQIIWNMKANCYKDDAGEIEDPMKPVLDSMTDMVVRSLSGESRAFYDREFSFFNEVTSISGKLKPYVKKAKPEKKAKIDEEMAKIIVDVGVYLPSNPDGVVIDIDKKSGRPLQSHAKTPFMATFKVRKERIEVNSDPDSLLNGEGSGVETRTEYDVLQQAIFKVGDDCRQDVLALQIIAMFKNIFTSIGLTLYLLPYRVTATGPGHQCGVIDVVPNSTSRDEMGRQKVNDLQDFFIAKYGGQDTTSFQKARLNFIQSMAAYSVACYILQIKDRHNGNIMIDGEGHIVHIGQPLLRPGGVKFEPSSFKLNHEMVVLMGGRYSQGYQLFQNLTVRAFLAIRPYAEQIIGTVQLMLDSGLPSFKGEPTIRRLRDRFALHLNERQAADYMMGIIRNAHENVRSTAYDEFQRLQNGIPYK